MLSHRLRGIVNLHVFGAAVVATGYFLLLVAAAPYLPRLNNLSPNVHPLAYAAPIIAGMLLSARYCRILAARFHAITWQDAARVASRQILIVALLIFSLLVATKDRLVSRVFLASYLGSCWFLLIFINRWLPKQLAEFAFHRHHRVPTLLVGDPTAVEALSHWITQKQHLGFDVVGIITENSPSTDSLTLPYLGSIERLASVLEQNRIGQVIVLGLPNESGEALHLVEACQVAGARLLIYQNFWDHLPIPMTPLIEDNHFFLTAHDEPLEDPANRAAKRVIDIIISLPVVIIVLPLLCAGVAVMQSLQAPGPLFFKRKRGGQRRREFAMLKFRSMFYAPPNRKLESLQATAGDTRIFPFGAFLRRTSLDEFPQFWNVLIGDMSIVGPRPHLTQHDEEFSQVAKAYRTRHLVKPGLTGLAQVSGFRGEIKDPTMLLQRVQLDIHYITNWSLWLDCQIVMRTISHLIFPPKSAV